MTKMNCCIGTYRFGKHVSRDATRGTFITSVRVTVGLNRRCRVVVRVLRYSPSPTDNLGRRAQLVRPLYSALEAYIVVCSRRKLVA